MRTVRTFVAVAGAFVVFSTAEAAPGQPGLTDQAPSVSGRPAKRVLASNLDRPNLEAWLDGFIPYALQQGDIAGAVVMVVKDGAVLLEKGYGYADVANKVPMDPQRTIMGVGSVSKLFTWTAVMQLVEQGRLDLDRNVNDYLDFKIPDAFGKAITLRNLMTHTAGFEELLKQYTTAGSVPRSLAEYLKAIPAPRRIYAPGSVPAYSNYGANLAGYIVQRISGEPFSSDIEDHIVNPLDMRRSTFRRPPPPLLLNDLAKNYGLASSGEVLMPETSRLMHATAFVPMAGAQAVALGFFRNDTNGHRIIAHDGDLSGFHTDLELLLNDGVMQLTRIAAAIGVLYLLGWTILGIAISAGAISFDVGTDPWMRVIQLIGLLTVPGLAVAVWNAWLTCTKHRAWWLMAWSIVIPLALFALLWFSFAFHVIGISLNY